MRPNRSPHHLQPLMETVAAAEGTQCTLGGFQPFGAAHPIELRSEREVSSAPRRREEDAALTFRTTSIRQGSEQGSSCPRSRPCDAESAVSVRPTR